MSSISYRMILSGLLIFGISQSATAQISVTQLLRNSVDKVDERYKDVADAIVMFQRNNARVAMALLAGGGMRNGQVIGSTDRLGGEATSRPVTFGDIFATLYHNLGIDINRATIPDLHGRPRYLVDHHEHQPIREVV